METTGYAVVCVGDAVPTILDAGVFTTQRRSPLPQRLLQLGGDFAEVLCQWRPVLVGVEQLYAHYKHPRTAIQMAHARGVLLAAAARHGAEVHSFNATRVKKHLTGNGRASKSQMQRAVQHVFDLPVIPEPADVADALAVVLCCAAEYSAGQLEAAR